MKITRNKTNFVWACSALAEVYTEIRGLLVLRCNLWGFFCVILKQNGSDVKRNSKGTVKTVLMFGARCAPQRELCKSSWIAQVKWFYLSVSQLNYVIDSGDWSKKVWSWLNITVIGQSETNVVVNG